jgi:hypothetical protein
MNRKAVIESLKREQLGARRWLIMTTAALAALGVGHGKLGIDSKPRRARLTAQGRRNIAKAQRARWAKIKKARA